MSDFTRSLKVNVASALGQGPAWDKINPLVVIGLNEAMLDLGLNEEQMFSLVRGYARRLAAEVHPDSQQSNVSADRQREILSAFDILDDRATFSQALKEFRGLKSEDRREIRMLRESLARAKVIVDEARASEATLDSRWQELVVERAQFETTRTNLEVSSQASQQTADKLEVRVSSLRRRLAGVMERNKQAYNYLSLLGSSATTNLENGVHAFDAKWVVVASLVPAKYEIPSPTNSSDKWTRVFLQTIKPLGLSPVQLQELHTRWQEVQVHLAVKKSKKRKEYKRTYDVRLTAYGLVSGQPSFCFGFGSEISGGRVIGSVSPNGGRVIRRTLFRSLDPDMVVMRLTPFLSVGRLLVTSKSQAPDTRHAWQEFSAVEYGTKRVILGVG